MSLAKNMSSMIALAAFAVGMLFAGTASAASITNVEFGNGDVTVQGNAGQNVPGKVRVVVANNEEVERVEFDIISDNLAPVCADIGRLQEGTHFVQIPGDVKFPPNTGTYTLQVKTAGIFGGLAAIDCTSNVNGTASFGSAVRTVGGNTSSNVGGSTVQTQIDALALSLKALTDAVAKLVAGGGTTAPTKPACPVTGDAWAVQTWLFANGYANHFTSKGVYAPTGFYGPITAGAVAAATLACK